MALKVRSKALKKMARSQSLFYTTQNNHLLVLYDKLGVIKSYEGAQFW